jgi:hypothetical protein
VVRESRPWRKLSYIFSGERRDLVGIEQAKGERKIG